MLPQLFMLIQFNPTQQHHQSLIIQQPIFVIYLSIINIPSLQSNQIKLQFLMRLRQIYSWVMSISPSSGSDSLASSHVVVPSEIRIPVIDPGAAVLVHHHLFEGFEKLEFISSPIIVHIHLPHEPCSLHLAHSFVDTTHSEEFIEEVGKFMSFKGTVSVCIVPGHDLVDVLLQLHVIDTSIDVGCHVACNVLSNKHSILRQDYKPTSTSKLIVKLKGSLLRCSWIIVLVGDQLVLMQIGVEEI